MNFRKRLRDLLKVDDLLCDDMRLSVSCAGAKRVLVPSVSRSSGDVVQGLVIVQLRSKEDKKAVSKAKGKLRGNHRRG